MSHDDVNSVNLRIALLTALLLPGSAIAANATEALYSVLYSNDSELCRFVRDNLNAARWPNELVPDPKRTLDQSTKWTPIEDSFVEASVLELDIDNDGETESVVRDIWWMGDRFEVNNLQIFERRINPKSPFDAKIFRSAEGSITLNRLPYCLEECQNNGSCGDTDAQVAAKRLGSRENWKDWCLGPSFVVRPFSFSENVYILIQDYPDERSQYRMWAVVGQYYGGHVKRRHRKPGTPILDSDVLVDRCYLERDSNYPDILDR